MEEFVKIGLGNKVFNKNLITINEGDGIYGYFDESGNKVNIIFPNTCFVIQISERSNLENMIIKQKLDIEEVYEVRNSKYLKYFHEDTCNMFVDKLVKHYVVISENEILEVLTSELPKFEEII